MRTYHPRTDHWEAGIWYTRNEKIAKEIGHKKFIYFSQCPEGTGEVFENFVYTHKREDMMKLVNHWNGMRSQWIYWYPEVT